MVRGGGAPGAALGDVPGDAPEGGDPVGITADPLVPTCRPTVVVNEKELSRVCAKGGGGGGGGKGEGKKKFALHGRRGAPPPPPPPSLLLT